MTHRDSQHHDHGRGLRLMVHGRRTRVVVALLGFVFSLGLPVAVIGTPVPTVDGYAIGRLEDPAGLGVTGALPRNSMAGDPTTSDPSLTTSLTGEPVQTDSAGAGPQGIATPPNLPDGPLGIPGAVLDAYQFAQRTLVAIRPGCHLSWSVLAGIGRIESDHASDGRVDAFGNTLGPILGPRLDGSPGMAAIPDTDHGQLDTDPVWDRAVGPMQFIPSSWHAYGVDGNGDGVANPNNIYDATVTTGIYLCAGGADLADPAQLQAAVLRYNHSATYVDIVLRWAQAYLTGVVPTPSAPGPVPPGINGNGGRQIVTDASSLAAAVTQPTSPAVTPLATTSSSPPPPVTTTTPPTTTPAATESSPPPPPSAPPTTTPLATAMSSPPPPSAQLTTTPLATAMSPLPPQPTAIVTLPATTSSSPPPPPPTKP